MGKPDEYIPEFAKGEVLSVKSLGLQEGKTSPPDYLTEAELIGLMVCVEITSTFCLAGLTFNRNKMVSARMPVFPPILIISASETM